MRVCVRVCWNVLVHWRMIEVEQAVLEALVRERACRRPPGAFHLCLVLESSRGNDLHQVETEEGTETNYLSEPAIIIIREAAALLPRAYSHLHWDRGRTGRFSQKCWLMPQIFQRTRKGPHYRSSEQRLNILFSFCPLTWQSPQGSSFEVHTLL